MSSIVHRSDPTNLKWLPNCSHAYALFQDRFKDVQVVQGGSVHCTSSHQTFTFFTCKDEPQSVIGRTRGKKLPYCHMAVSLLAFR